jgi:hypothetical protein
MYRKVHGISLIVQRKFAPQKMEDDQVRGHCDALSARNIAPSHQADGSRNMFSKAMLLVIVICNAVYPITKCTNPNGIEDDFCWINRMLRHPWSAQRS